MRAATALAFVLCLAPAVASAQQSCLVLNQIWSWRPADSSKRVLIVQDRIHRDFRVTLAGPCPNIDYNLRAGFESNGTSNLDCLRRGDLVVHRGYGVGNRCVVQSVEPYTAAMQKADEAAKQPSQ